MDNYRSRSAAIRKYKRPTIKKFKPQAAKNNDLYDQLMNSLQVKKGA